MKLYECYECVFEFVLVACHRKLTNFYFVQVLAMKNRQDQAQFQIALLGRLHRKQQHL